MRTQAYAAVVDEAEFFMSSQGGTKDTNQIDDGLVICLPSGTSE
jgi:hypothetical protein